MTGSSTRRAVLACSAAAFATLAPAIRDATAATGADARLIELGISLHEAWDIAKAAEEAGLSDDAVDAAYVGCHCIVSEIEALTATTLAGLRVKVMALSWTHCGEPFDDTFFDGAGTTTDYRLTMGIIRDIVAGEIKS